MVEMMVETHPLAPFLPANARLLMLGSFPPPAARWKMHFYYPNLQNDMWRIFGLVFFQDKHYFFTDNNKAFNESLIRAFLSERGIAINDTAYQIRRLQNNAADKFLEVITPVDLPALLAQIPDCQHIMTTGDKATSTLLKLLPTDTVAPTIGHPSNTTLNGRHLTLSRLPSSSRAYPLALAQKAAIYRDYFYNIGLLN
ncbi:uracil-DNA glycosylase family protein [Snodgrassella alvi]|jgi:G:T/U-mismatch repair DNA glycosylase|uniref:uracil-DNA glycosylase family protein n=1 Tax=Snodgrassella alvi TaxID=1196083 RepID=UPI000C1E8D68|nr:DNA glycosylase [Snodgrassella alvi]PIT50998.1 DNA glycosylase [Snodgrassella alvi]